MLAPRPLALHPPNKLPGQAVSQEGRSGEVCHLQTHRSASGSALQGILARNCSRLHQAGLGRPTKTRGHPQDRQYPLPRTRSVFQNDLAPPKACKLHRPERHPGSSVPNRAAPSPTREGSLRTGPIDKLGRWPLCNSALPRLALRRESHGRSYRLPRKSSRHQRGAVSQAKAVSRLEPRNPAPQDPRED